MKKHIFFFISLIALVFIVEGIAFFFSVRDSLDLGLKKGAAVALFIGLVHLFIAYGLLRQKRWAPHLGIFFELYIVLNFAINNRQALFSPALLPSALTVLSASAFLAASLFVLRNQFTE